MTGLRKENPFTVGLAEHEVPIRHMGKCPAQNLGPS